ncbi:aldehyde dehydrogenase family protein [Virgibacillus pantothenticus]|uniref:aldehyde dehydrogenase family protein n=1 Tax=Virgibacillus pantothenticus TaxID=1473 RepID=UPI001C21DEDF|nr:aldehyde dehydrogenase family protein [Virgibacillus pantothenticus]MBU8567253.1 aldehyde dehydrogenase family protein [Virgibacillus pantothenticus]MBU8600009.1 aldehyde dehydrogenase family protein [Virgibacillus pantothenticus]MBU8635410.1 aldehyde dehydrogenase family protein [Virgibacillus pantothenticus]MBU8642304.1 aldehyde dehydrogenase family protein [Virgibacillus pantothenticus]MBU8646258.1 aldehyde dehydrogenase family protein [Virgibacillus pantothenticus]
MTTILQTDKLKNFIAGEWQEANPTVAVHNPATGEEIVHVPLSGKKEVDQAVAAAKQAQKEWALVPAPQRAEVLYEVGNIMKERKERLSQLLTTENGKVLEEARGEVQEGIDMAFYMAGEGRRLFGQTTPAELKDKFAMSQRCPVGVVGIITPWNFPIAIATWKSFPAIVAGNAVVWKPATETPIMAYELAKIFAEAGLPKGVLNVVFGSGASVGHAMVHHDDIRVISFTGSNNTGRDIAAACGSQLKKVSLEMGGKNAVIVLEDADLDLAAEGIIWSAFGTSGQRCTACSRVIVHEHVKEQLEERLLVKLEELTIGNGLDESVKVGPIINRAGLEKIKKYVQIGKEEGATLLAGGEEWDTNGELDGYFFTPTIFTDANATMRITQEEIFGPVVSLIPVKDFEEAIQVNNQVSYGLSSSIFTNDVNRVFRAQRDLDTGIVYVNAGTTGAEIHLPFGGTKGTGNGHRDSGVQALDVFTEWKAIYVDYSGKLQRAQIDIE